ncbi:MAG: DUF2341 domain-containing protein [Bacteroidia bacterium]
MKLKHLLSVVLVVITGAFAKAQLPGYSNMKSITVSNSTSSLAIGYQLKLTVNTQSLISASQMLATGDDIRFGKTCSGSVLYNYWIESGINTPTTVIWVNIDSIPAGGNRTFYMYYGNPSATAVSSIPLVFPFAGSSTDSVSNGTSGGSTNSQRGFRFSPNVDVLVTSFGKYEPNGSTRYVTLFDVTTQSIVAQQQINGPALQYSYTALPNPLWLTQSTQYILQLYQGASDGYVYGTSSQIDNRLTYYDMRYCNSCTQNTFPTSVLANYHYGYADFCFYYRNMLSPAPTYTFANTVLPSLAVAGPTTTSCAGSAITLTASGTTSYSWSTGQTAGTVAVTPIVNSTYTVTGFLNGCSDSKTISVSVTSPTITANSGTICNGQSFTITPSGASTYTFSGGNAVVSPTTTSSYTVTGTDAQGCVSLAGAVSSITVNTVPAVSAVSNMSLICTGSSATLTASGASSYTWNSGATGTTIVISPTITTSYTVSSSANGCTGLAMVTQSVSACTSLNSLNLISKINIYPNPTNGLLNIEIDGSAVNVKIQVINALGEVLIEETPVLKSNSYNLNQYPNGLYFVKISENNHVTKIEKVIKQ